MTSQMDGSSIRVLCRIRPLNEKELREQEENVTTSKFPAKLNHPVSSKVVKEIFTTDYEENYIRYKSGLRHGEDLVFTFDKLFSAKASQEDIFDSVKLLANDWMEGYNATLMCYGQTGSGKTYTTIGTKENPGVVVNCLKYLFESMGQKTGIRSSFLKCSFLEIYLDRVIDLLLPANDESTLESLRSLRPKIGRRVKEEANRKGPKVYEYNDGNVVIKNLWEEYIDQPEAAVKLLNKAATRRITHEVSSRSHMLLIFTLEQQMEDGTIKISKMNFVDLAGSEKAKENYGGRSVTFDEMVQINMALCTLRKVIQGLASKQKHVPFRDSKLTHILKDSISGNFKTVLITCITEALSSRPESISSLRFSKDVQKVSTRAIINLRRSRNDLERLIQSLKQEIQDNKTIDEENRKDAEEKQVQLTQAKKKLQSAMRNVTKLKHALARTVRVTKNTQDLVVEDDPMDSINISPEVSVESPHDMDEGQTQGWQPGFPEKGKNDDNAKIDAQLQALAARRAVTEGDEPSKVTGSPLKDIPITNRKGKKRHAEKWWIKLFAC